MGSAVAFITVVTFGLIKGGLNPFLGLLFMFALGAFLGFLTGSLVAHVKIPPFIATLGMMAGLRGLALVHSAGEMHFGLPTSITYIGQGSIGGIPVPVIISLATAVFGAWLFNRTRFGLHVRAIGGNREAVRLAGVPVNRVEGPGLRADGSVHSAGRPHHDGPNRLDAGDNRERHGDPRDLGCYHRWGPAFSAGAGPSMVPWLGALLLSMMTNALIIAGVDFFWQLVVMGGIVLIAVAISNLREQRIPALAHIIWRKPTGGADTKPA